MVPPPTVYMHSWHTFMMSSMSGKLRQNSCHNLPPALASSTADSTGACAPQRSPLTSLPHLLFPPATALAALKDHIEDFAKDGLSDFVASTKNDEHVSSYLVPLLVQLNKSSHPPSVPSLPIHYRAPQVLNSVMTLHNTFLEVNQLTLHQQVIPNVLIMVCLLTICHIL